MSLAVKFKSLPHALRPALAIAFAVALVTGWCLATKAATPAAESKRLIGWVVVDRQEMPLQKLLENNLEQYTKALDSFDANIRIQALLIVFSLLLIIRRSDALDVIGNPVPLSWLHLLIPSVLIYYWLSFGFLLDDLIETRITGANLINAIDDSLAGRGPIADSFRDTALSLYHDSGFVDGWFVTFVDTGGRDYTGINHNFSDETASFLVVVLGSLISAAHASLLALCIVGCRRYLTTNSGRWLAWYYGLPFIPLAFLVVSHIQFAYGGENKNTLQLFIAAFTPLLLAALLALSVMFDEKVRPESLACLRRQCIVVRDGNRGITALQSTADRQNRVPLVRIALLADSLSTGFYVGNALGMWWRLWRSWRVSWFASLPFSTEARKSVVDRLAVEHAIVAYHLGSVSAEVTAPRRRTLVDRLLNRWHFVHQVDELLVGDMPDVVLLWIGHNNVDWLKLSTSYEEDEMVRTFRNDYEAGVRRIVAKAEADAHPTTIIVFGLINFRSFFSCRDDARASRERDPSLFPYFDKCHKYFGSMRPQHQKRMAELADLYNHSLQQMCNDIQCGLAPQITVIYSAAFSAVDLSPSNSINEKDAWHPSIDGHALLARASFCTIEQALKKHGSLPKAASLPDLAGVVDGP